MVIPRTVKKLKMTPILAHVLDNGGLAIAPKMGFPQTPILQRGRYKIGVCF